MTSTGSKWLRVPPPPPSPRPFDIMVMIGAVLSCVIVVLWVLNMFFTGAALILLLTDYQLFLQVGGWGPLYNVAVGDVMLTMAMIVMLRVFLPLWRRWRG